MNILAEIQRTPGLNVHGRAIHRTAVRAVILQGRALLMIYSSNVGDYKFPGGGVRKGESHARALQREVQEECGMSLANVGVEIGIVIEYDVPLEAQYEVFKMRSYYYRCRIQSGIGAQKLDAYEQELGFRPVWIDIEDAIQCNRALLGLKQTPEWLRREIFMLEYIQERKARNDFSHFADT